MKRQSITIGSKFLVLLDFSETSLAALRYTIKLAKTVLGEISLYHAAKAADVCATTHEQQKIREQLESIIEMIETEGIKAHSHYETGKTKKLIGNKIKSYEPDVVVVGKESNISSKSSQVTKFLIEQYDGHLLVVGDNGDFQEDTKITVALDGLSIEENNLKTASDLAKCSENPLTIVNITDDHLGYKQSPFDKSWDASGIKNFKVEHFKSENIEKGLKEYISNKEAQLLCISRNTNKKSWFDKLMGKTSCITSLMKNINVPVLVLS